MAANPESRQCLRVRNWIPGSRATRVPRNDAESHRYHRQRRGNLVSYSCHRAGHLSDPPGPAGGRLRRRRTDRHPGPLHRRQARHAARPARHRREQDGRRRHARDPRRAGAAGRRLQPPALHALRIDQHGALQESGLQALRPRADLADRASTTTASRSPTRSPRTRSSSSCIRQGAAGRSELRHARRGLGAGNHGAAVREARRHLDEPHSRSAPVRRSCRT